MKSSANIHFFFDICKKKRKNFSFLRFFYPSLITNHIITLYCTVTLRQLHPPSMGKYAFSYSTAAIINAPSTLPSV